MSTYVKAIFISFARIFFGGVLQMAIEEQESAFFPIVFRPTLLFLPMEFGFEAYF
jgi:hypothetical protein